MFSLLIYIQSQLIFSHLIYIQSSYLHSATSYLYSVTLFIFSHHIYFQTPYLCSVSSYLYSVRSYMYSDSSYIYSVSYIFSQLLSDAATRGRDPAQVFSCKYCETLTTPILKNTCGRLLLFLLKSTLRGNCHRNYCTR